MMYIMNINPLSLVKPQRISENFESGYYFRITEDTNIL